MFGKRMRIVIAFLLGVGSFGVWVFFRPLMVVWGVWGGAEFGTMQEELKWSMGQLGSAGYLLLSNGLIAGGILLAAWLWGFWTQRRILRLAEGDWLTGVGVGLVCLSLTVFLLGWAGVLVRWVFVLVLGVMAAPGGIEWVVWKARSGKQAGGIASEVKEVGGLGWVLVALMPMLALGVLGALLPAGVLWAQDGRGFDCLEYHLQLPREYLQMGRIAVLDHNVFSHFPANAEMLYLLAMVLRGDAVEGMYLGQALNLAMGILFVWGLVTMDRRQGGGGGVIAAVAAAGCPLFFVATNAYVECYLLLMMLLGVENAVRLKWEGEWEWKRAVLAGIFCGAACGTKYTAVAMAAPVIVLYVLWAARAKVSGVLLTVAAGLLVFAPWLVRNAVERSNPVFPMGTEYFGKGHWTEEQVTRWEKAHRAAEAEASWLARWRALGREGAGVDRYIGLAVLLALTAAGARWRCLRGISGMSLLSIGYLVWVWMGFTHLQTRFLLPVLVPAGYFIAGNWERVRAAGGWWKTIAAISVLSGTLTTAALVERYNRSTYQFAALAGQDDLVAAGYPFSNAAEAAGKRVLLVGESRPFYVQGDVIYNTVFDRSGWVDALEKGEAAAVIGNLRGAGITHVYVNWAEIERLRKSYGFGLGLTRQRFAILEQAGLTIERKEGINEQKEPMSVLYAVKP